MEIHVFTTGRNGRYSANGLFDGKKLIVLKGSQISSTTGAKVNPIVEEMRNDPKIVSSDFVVLSDVSFKSASTAAAFVTGNISNGMRVWKLDSGKALGSMIGENKE